MFTGRVIHFEETLRDQVKVSPPKKLQSLMEVSNLVHGKVHVLSFNMILTSSPERFLTPSSPFRKDLGYKVKGSSLKKLKILIEVPQVCQVKVHVFSFNMILLSSPLRVPRPSYPFRRNFGRSGKGSFSEKAKIVN